MIPDFSSLAHLPIVDGHVHFNDSQWMPDIVRLMDTIPLTWINLVSMPDLKTVNQNPEALYFKTHYPGRVYISGGLDYIAALADRPRMAEALAAQVRMLKAIGFDGMKFIEGKPTVRPTLDIPLDAPEYDLMWGTMEELGFPAVFHVADPEEFWDPVEAPDWARANGWYYGDGGFPAKEALYGEVDHILARHPCLKLIFAHFYFLSADLDRAARFFDAHPSVCFDLTPGTEMYANFTRTADATRDFFLSYQDRLVYGTDTETWSMARNGIAPALTCAQTVRTFLESDGLFTPPDAHWLKPGLTGLHALALPREVLEKIYHANFQRLYGASPAPLDAGAAAAEIARIAVAREKLAVQA